MITRVKIDNFKSLVDFELPPGGGEMGGFTCLIGLNGSGKSTLLQAFDFIAQVATGNVSDWLERRDWKKGEIVCNLNTKRPLVTFTLGFRLANGVEVEWLARYNSNQLKCTWEQIQSNGKTLLKLDEGWIAIAKPNGELIDGKGDKLQFDYQGSVLSALRLVDAHPAIGEIKKAMEGLRSLELLSPQSMRKRAKDADDIGSGGEKLSAFLSSFSGTQKEALNTLLRQFYPTFENFHINTLRYGWKNLRVWEDYIGNAGVDALHLNDGLLRVIAILAQAQSKHGVVLFDEIENGINPALVEKLMDFLVGIGREGKQVIVTTHSPIILNFLEDEVAKQAVILLYKNHKGLTHACRYFDQPETSDKLRALGPGEVFADTDLTRMVARLAEATPDKEPQPTNGK